MLLEEFKEVDLHRLEPAAFEPIERSIYADATRAASSDEFVAPGRLHKSVRHLDAGQIAREYHGQPKTWMDQIAGPVRQYVTNIKEPT